MNAPRSVGQVKDEGDRSSHGRGLRAPDEPTIRCRVDMLPPGASWALVRAAQGGWIVELDEELHDGKLSYEANIVIGRVEFEISVDADGNVVELNYPWNDKRVEPARKSRNSNRQDAKDAKILFSSWRSWRSWRFILWSIDVIGVLTPRVRSLEREFNAKAQEEK